MTAMATKWSPWKSHNPRVTVRQAIERSPHKDEFMAVLDRFAQKANQWEIVDVHFWYSPYVYLGIVDTRWQHYPCGHRTLVSFDLTSGKWASFDSENRYVYARKGWGQFMDALVGYKVTRYSDCGKPEKTSSC